jgi:hypothetical protein
MPGNESSSASQRVPQILQNIFLSSQGGDDVAQIQAPSNGMGSTMFRRAWGRKQKKVKASMSAPSSSSLSSERSGIRSRGETAAESSRKAIKDKQKTQIQAPVDQESPQASLDKSFEARGYSVKKYCSLEGGYYCRPSPLQQASYGTLVSGAIRASDSTLLRRLLDAGISPNPCNNFGESLVHMVCRRGDHKLLRILLEAGCSLQVTDDYGRTPLHDACWRADPSWEVVQLILDSDKHLFNLLDCRGTAPLGYVKKENYQMWADFLAKNLDRVWPKRDLATEGEESPPPLTLRQPHSLPIPDPAHGLPLEVAAMVANGRMAPEEALYLDDSSDDDDDDDDDESSVGSEDASDDDSYDSDDSDDSEDSDIDAEEMAEICMRAGGPMAIARKCFGSDAKVVVGDARKTA